MVLYRRRKEERGVTDAQCKAHRANGRFPLYEEDLKQTNGGDSYKMNARLFLRLKKILALYKHFPI